MKNLGKTAALSGFKAVADGTRAHEKISAQIKNAILEKRLGPGARLPAERELVEIFGTSRVTVRAAILTLRNAGLLNIRKGAGGGTFVTEDMGGESVSDLLRDIIQWKDIDIRHVVEVRGIIEPRIAFLAAKNATDEDVENIRATLWELEHFFKVKTKFKSTDENFHKALAAAAGNPLLSVFQAALIDVLFKFIYDVVWQEEHKGNILVHHRRIAEKVGSRDSEGAMQAMVDHLDDMQRILAHCPETRIHTWIKH